MFRNMITMTTKMRVRHHADGRRSFPGIVQYQLGDQLLDLPPTAISHRDMTPLRPGGRPEGYRSLPWKPIIHNRDAYDRLWLAGMLHIGHTTLDPGCVGD